MENSGIEAYVTNLGKYNEGELVGEWVKFPVTLDELKAVYERIGIDAEHEEVFITDYDMDLYGVSKQLGEYESLDKLNYLAGLLENLSVPDREKYEAVLESGISIEQSGIDGLINLAYNLEKYDLLTEVKDEDDLGRYYAELTYGEDLNEKMGELANYIDFERYGSDCQINEAGMFTDAGYMRDTGEEWNEYYDGSLEDIPEEYRLTGMEEREAEKIKVLVIEPMKKPYVKEMEHTLENLQREVGGNIEAVYPFQDRAAIICNDDHKFNGSQLNRCLRDENGEVYDILAGNFMVAGLTEYDFGSLTDEQIDRYSNLFGTPEMFVKVGEQLVVLPVPESELEKQVQKDNPDKFMIYQLKEEKSLNEYRFASTQDLDRKRLNIDKNNYWKVFESTKTNSDTLDSIYKKYNMEHPEGFRGHNLSMSDIIVLHVNGEDRAYYVDFDGFTEVPEFLNANEQNKYSIYQLKQGEEMRDYKFASKSELQSRGLSVNPENYEKVYETPKTDSDTLDSIYYKFNMEHPADFRGHSLSVSDVIVFHENGVDTAHYVDSFGFTAVPEFLSQKELAVDIDTTGLMVEGHDGTWHSLEELAVHGNTYYLMESEAFGQDANMVVVDCAGKLVAEDITPAMRADVGEIVAEVLNLEAEAMVAPIDPDRSITQEDMISYGYEWGGMLPVREDNAKKLYDAGLEVFALHPDDTESSLDSKEAIIQHAQNGGIFGIEKMRWSAFVESNPLKKVEELLEDDYGMIDGIINNGSKQEKENEAVEKNKSVMEKLSEGREAVKKYDKENTPEQPKKARPEREV